MIIVDNIDFLFPTEPEPGASKEQQHNEESSTTHSEADEQSSLASQSKMLTSSDSPAHKPKVPQQIYPAKIDMSRIPYFYVGEDSDDESGVYEFPENDAELLGCCARPAARICKGKLKRSSTYFVQVRGDSCTADQCIQLLKTINCEKQFISCSVESASFFLAELHKDEAVELRGSPDVRKVFLFSSRLFDL